MVFTFMSINIHCILHLKAAKELACNSPESDKRNSIIIIHFEESIHVLFQLILSFVIFMYETESLNRIELIFEEKQFISVCCINFNFQLLEVWF